MSDGIGRRKTVWFGATIMCIATAVQTASQSVGMFIGARFLIGFGLTFAGKVPVMSIINACGELCLQPMPLLCWSPRSHILHIVPL
jgi:MFS family permease